MPIKQNILFCRCTFGGVVPAETRDAVLKSLVESGRCVDVVDDLCAMAESRDPRLSQLAAAPDAVVIACHARAVRALFDFAGAKLRDDAHLLDARSQSADAILQTLAGTVPALFAGSSMLTGNVSMAPGCESENCPQSAGRASCACDGETSSPVRTPDATAAPPGNCLPTGWQSMPWFPVIDRGRCTACGKCASFCLFGVYAKDDDGAIRVANPRNCKPLCPACARVCPSKAIIFPKYSGAADHGNSSSETTPASLDSSGFIAGQEISADDAAASPADVQSLLQGDLRDALRRRDAGK